MAWVKMPVYDGSAYTDKLVNLDRFQSMDPHDSGVRSKLIDGATELIIDIAFDTLSDQIKTFTGGYDAAGSLL